MCPVQEPLICPVVIGRGEETAFLVRTLARGAEGQGQAVLVAGEAGIGKSRLVAAALELLGEQGWTVLRGNFFEPDHSIPYAGITDLIRRYLRSSPAGAAAKLASAELGALAPELNVPGSNSAFNANLDKRRLMEAFNGLLSGLSADRPVALVLEDLHWADGASLELILLVSRLAASHPLVVFLTYRSDEVQASLAHLIASLEREHLAAEVRLNRLNSLDVDGMLQAMLRRPRPVHSGILREIFELTDGNPFFVEEVARALSEETSEPWEADRLGATPIPHSVNDAVMRRSAELTEETRRVLQLASVAGRRFDFPLLLHLSGLGEGGLTAAVEELIAAQLVVEESPETFSFRHALTRQAVYSSMFLRERSILHGRTATAIREIHAASLEEKQADLAYHASEAADWPNALSHSLLAGDRALSLFSPAAAAVHFSQALLAASHVRRTDPRALRGRGKAYEQIGDFDRALTDYEGALAEMIRLEDQNGRWQCLLDLAMLWAGKDYERTGEYLEKASALAQEIGDPSQIAHSLNRVANWLVNVERPMEGVALHREALAIFEELADLRGIAATLDLLGMANCLVGDLVEACANYREAIPIFEQLDDRQGLASSLATLLSCGGDYLTDASVAGDDASNLRPAADRALTVSREIGQRSAESYAQWQRAVFLGARGEFGAALEAARNGLAIAIEIEHTQWEAGSRCALGAILSDLLDFSGAREQLEAAASLARETKSGWWAGVSGQLLAQVLIAVDDLSAAEALLSSLGRGVEPWTVQQRQAEAARAELVLARGGPAGALQLVTHLIDAAPNIGNGRPIPRLWRLRAAATLALGNREEAEVLLSEALASGLGLGSRGLIWRMQTDLAALYALTGDTRAEAVAATQASSLIEELAASVAEEPLASNFRQAALEQLSGPLPVQHPAPRPVYPDGLTEREVEILRLIASGKSNREIAEELVLSIRTVERHIANLYAKAGVRTKAQATDYAHRRGLT